MDGWTLEKDVLLEVFESLEAQQLFCTTFSVIADLVTEILNIILHQSVMVLKLFGC